MIDKITSIFITALIVTAVISSLKKGSVLPAVLTSGGKAFRNIELGAQGVK